MLKGYIARRIRYGGPAYDQGLALGILSLIALPVTMPVSILLSFVKNPYVFFVMFYTLITGSAFAWRHFADLDLVSFGFTISAWLALAFSPAIVLLKVAILANEGSKYDENAFLFVFFSLPVQVVYVLWIANLVTH